MKIGIRLATITDAKQIAQVHVTSWKSIYRGQISDDFLNNLSIENREQEWQGYLNSGVVVSVGEFENKIIGFASICPTRDPDHDPKQVAEISAIYLLPEFWRKGLGQKLCQSVIDHVIKKGFTKITVWVLESNKQARSFYEKFGFCYTGHTEMDHIGCESFPVVRMMKTLL